MGLDMYLHKKTYVGNKYREEGERLQLDNSTELRGIKSERISSIEEEVAYWRKCNHIHGFFVREVQGGIDDCCDHYVSRSNLIHLVSLCKEVLARRDEYFSEGELPTQQGFFFGEGDYSEWYYSSLEDTIKQIEPLIEEEDGDFYYTSSW